MIKELFLLVIPGLDRFMAATAPVKGEKDFEAILKQGSAAPNL
jgi:hypothetical protein